MSKKQHVDEDGVVCDVPSPEPIVSETNARSKVYILSERKAWKAEDP